MHDERHTNTLQSLALNAKIVTILVCIHTNQTTLTPSQGGTGFITEMGKAPQQSERTEQKVMTPTVGSKDTLVLRNR